MADTLYNLSEAVGLQRFWLDWKNAKNHSTQMTETARREEILCRCICTKCKGYEHADGETYCVGGDDFDPKNAEDHIESAFSSDAVLLSEDGFADFNTRFVLNLSNIETLPFKIRKVLKYININSTDLRELDLSNVKFHEGKNVDPATTTNGSYGISLMNNRNLNSLESIHLSRINYLNYVSIEPSFFTDSVGIWSEYKKLREKRVSMQTAIGSTRQHTFVPFKPQITGHILNTIANKNSTFDASDLRHMIKYLKELVKTK